jgi:hypothetical protein
MITQLLEEIEMCQRQNGNGIHLLLSERSAILTNQNATIPLHNTAAHYYYSLAPQNDKAI